MRIQDLLRFTAAFYPNWDPHYAEQLRQEFRLDLSARVRTLSQGQQAKAALLVALAYRPELLILDEPSTGLDPVVRRDILEAIIRTIAEQGRTVLFSSHLLDEVERVSDHLAMIREGRLVLHGALDEIKSNHRQFVLNFAVPQASPPKIPGALTVTGSGREWRLLCHGPLANFSLAAAQLGATIVEEQASTLD